LCFILLIDLSGVERRETIQVVAEVPIERRKDENPLGMITRIGEKVQLVNIEEVQAEVETEKEVNEIEMVEVEAKIEKRE